MKNYYGLCLLKLGDYCIFPYSVTDKGKVPSLLSIYNARLITIASQKLRKNRNYTIEVHHVDTEECEKCFNECFTDYLYPLKFYDNLKNETD